VPDSGCRAAQVRTVHLGQGALVRGDACQAMGREQAAIAIAIVSAKPAEHFRSTPGGYFHGMVAKAKAGELNLARTVWGLRQSAATKSRRPSGAPERSGAKLRVSTGWR
jgi:replication initiation protein RepC